MPKQAFKIESFHGGLNTNADPRDIRDDEASKLQNVKISNWSPVVPNVTNSWTEVDPDVTNTWSEVDTAA